MNTTINDILTDRVIRSEVDALFTRPGPECLELIDWRLGAIMPQLNLQIRSSATDDERATLLARAEKLNSARDAAYARGTKDAIIDYFAEVQGIECAMAYPHRRPI